MSSFPLGEISCLLSVFNCTIMSVIVAHFTLCVIAVVSHCYNTFSWTRMVAEWLKGFNYLTWWLLSQPLCQHLQVIYIVTEPLCQHLQVIIYWHSDWVIKYRWFIWWHSRCVNAYRCLYEKCTYLTHGVWMKISKISRLFWNILLQYRKCRYTATVNECVSFKHSMVLCNVAAIWK